VPTRILRHFCLFSAVSAAVVYVALYAASLTDTPLRSDGYSYYVYLPAWFLHHDPTLQAVADDCCGGVFPAFTSIVRWPPTNQWVNPHPIGVAILMAPAFAAAHALTRWSNLPPDGFSFYYQHAAGLSGVAAFVFGLFCLRSLLSRHYREGVVLAALVAVTFGTNLFHYATYDSTFSHAFSFALVAALLDVTDLWWTQPTARTTVALSVIAALLFLVRHPNVVYLCVVPLWNPGGVARRWKMLAFAAALALVLVTPQLVVYRQATGRWFVSVYGELGTFHFGSPRIGAVLFGVQKGLFFWSPLLLLAGFGFLVGGGLAERLRVPAALIFAVVTYLIASWSDWQFGASFGHRGYTDGLALAAVFLASSFDRLRRHPRWIAPVAAATVLLVSLSVLQMYQYWRGILPNADTTWAQYREAFLRLR
jgi:hypothetical protein